MKKIRALIVSGKIVNIIQNLYKGTPLSVWNGAELAEEFDTGTGVRHGCII